MCTAQIPNPARLQQLKLPLCASAKLLQQVVCVGKLGLSVTDLGIADVPIVLQEGVGVGVKQHGSCGVVASAVGDPVGKQHIVKLQNKGQGKITLFGINIAAMRLSSFRQRTVKQVDNHTTDTLLRVIH